MKVGWFDKEENNAETLSMRLGKDAHVSSLRGGMCTTRYSQGRRGETAAVGLSLRDSSPPPLRLGMPRRV
jgi:hypothetical protein